MKSTQISNLSATNSTQLKATPGEILKDDGSNRWGFYATDGTTEVLTVDNTGNLIGNNASILNGAQPSISLANTNLVLNASNTFIWRFATGTNQHILSSTGLTTYRAIVTAGLGLSPVYAQYSTTSNTGAITNAVNYTPPATAGTYRLSWSVDTRTATTDNFTVVCTWKDAGGVARSQNSGGSDKNGTSLVAGAITNTIGAGTYYGSVNFQIDNSATAITLSTAGTFTTVTYDLAAWLEQIA